MNKLNEMQTLRSILAKDVNYDVEKAKKVWDFVVGHDDSQKESLSQQRKNGIYFIVYGGYPIHESEFDESMCNDCIGVGVLMGDKFATVSLRDANNGEDVALTNEDKTGDSSRFRQDFWEAMADWDGQGNTESMKSYLNPEINLEEYEYLPSVAQLHLILLFVNEINKALERVGGEPMRKNWYWSSTECGSLSSWFVNFSSGGTFTGGSKYSSGTVRPSVACEF